MAPTAWNFSVCLFLSTCLVCASGSRVRLARIVGTDPKKIPSGPGLPAKTKDGEDCVDKLNALGVQVHQLIMEITEQCGIDPDDIDDDLSLTEEAIEKMCGNEDCLASKTFVQHALPEGLEDLVAQCTDPASLNGIAFAEPGYTIVSNLYKAWSSCDRSSITAKNVSAPASKICPNPSMVAHNCVGDGESISEGECFDRGCCWDPPKKPREGRNWCYKDVGQKECQKRCPTEKHWSPQHREECTPFMIIDKFIKNHPDPLVRGQGCQEVGCCWDPLTHGSAEPWCFITPCLE